MAPNDPLTYRHPRTLEQAFGPDSGAAIKSSATRRPFFEKSDLPVMVTIAVGVLALLAAYYMGWRP